MLDGCDFDGVSEGEAREGALIDADRKRKKERERREHWRRRGRSLFMFVLRPISNSPLPRRPIQSSCWPSTTGEEDRGVGRAGKEAASEKKTTTSTVTPIRRRIGEDSHRPVARQRLLRQASPPRDGSTRSGSSP